MKSILVAVDFSELTEPCCQLAARLADPSGAALHLLHVAAPNPDFVGFEAGPDVERHNRAESLRDEHRQLEGLKQTLQDEGRDVYMHLVEGATADTILEQAGKLQAQMIVLGSHGHGALHHTLMGSVSHDVLKDAVCPVLFYPAASLNA
jgi:nucleotide-binding universal stress UspA family protein